MILNLEVERFCPGFKGDSSWEPLKNTDALATPTEILIHLLRVEQGHQYFCMALQVILLCSKD